MEASQAGVLRLVRQASYVDSLDTDCLKDARLVVVRNAFGGKDNPEVAAVNPGIDKALDPARSLEVTPVDIEIGRLIDHIVGTSLYLAHSRYDIKVSGVASQHADPQSGGDQGRWQIRPNAGSSHRYIRGAGKARGRSPLLPKTGRTGWISTRQGREFIAPSVSPSPLSRASSSERSALYSCFGIKIV
jgi:hypothetical protein